ncbi:6554_t:CDS:2 [Funneliformis caledonium]|uniref:6554_t:CDS:1 n=1 Tax=Funneliformis caledonium TaxID=1117310 RepID=A0A9N8Z7F3_9GLOM|nr:6554_t:CDS:2 [Funneliformis caledonium]
MPKDRTEETAISATTERGSTMDRSGSRWYEDSSKHNGGWPVYLLLDKHPSPEKINDSRETNKIPIQTSKPTVKLDNALGRKSYVSSHSVNNLVEVGPSETLPESEEDFVRSIVDRIFECQKNDIEDTTGLRHKEPANASTGQERESVGGRWHPGITATKQCQLSDDDAIQYEEENLPKLLNLLKNNYPFREVTNKDNILRNDEIERFTELYNITNVYPVLACYDSIFWLKDPDGVIYLWSRTDEMIIRGGGDMKEALINYLFHQENLCYINEYTHELIPIKEAEDKANKWYEEAKKTATKFTELAIYHRRKSSSLGWTPDTKLKKCNMSITPTKSDEYHMPDEIF